MYDDSASSRSHVPILHRNGSPDALGGGSDGAEATNYQVIDVRAQWRDRQRVQDAKRAEFLDNLLRNFDILMYIELAALYYLDCSFFFFIVRSIIQLYFLTPKPAFLELARPGFFVSAVIGPNIICLALHAFRVAPSAGEATRGYLHGSLLIDFVGQLGPTSKLRLVSLDALVLLLQVVMLAVHFERQSLKPTSTSASSTTPSLSPSAARDVDAVDISAENPSASLDDYDMEERGEHRHVPRISGSSDIEMRPLRRTVRAAGPDENRIGGDENAERDELLDDPADGSRESLTRDHPLDVFHSGEAQVASLQLLDIIRREWWTQAGIHMQMSEAGSGRPRAALAASWAGGRFRLRFGVPGRELGGS
ncbi:MAG: hypothetical protein M1825_002817 [Sarcosagium campestre]|nr:MAG: hypothetical protein M1825_002817 [Sarcosagium campestre]